MALDIENLSSTAKTVTETRVDRTTANPAATGVPRITEQELAGSQGLHIITGTQEHSGRFCRIRFITATVFAALEGHNLGGTWTTATFPAGSELVGYFTKVRLSSGSVALTHA